MTRRSPSADGSRRPPSPRSCPAGRESPHSPNPRDRSRRRGHRVLRPVGRCERSTAAPCAGRRRRAFEGPRWFLGGRSSTVTPSPNQAVSAGAGGRVGRFGRGPGEWPSGRSRTACWPSSSEPDGACAATTSTRPARCGEPPVFRKALGVTGQVEQDSASRPQQRGGAGRPAAVVNWCAVRRTPPATAAGTVRAPSPSPYGCRARLICRQVAAYQRDSAQQLRGGWRRTASVLRAAKRMTSAPRCWPAPASDGVTARCRRVQQCGGRRPVTCAASFQRG